MGALDRAAALAAAALALISCRPPDTGLAVLGAAIREQLLTIRARRDVIAAAWEEGRAEGIAEGIAEMHAEIRAAFQAGRAFEASIATAPAVPLLRLAAGGDARAGSPGATRPDLRLVTP